MSVRWFWTTDDGWTQMGPPTSEHTMQIGFVRSSVSASPAPSAEQRGEDA